jgi:uncharacterized protein DUF6796
MSSFDKKEKQIIMITGFVGLMAAILTGAGEFMLHYDPLARFSETGYDFMLAASEERQTMGHFFGVLGAPLYVVGCWHIYLMLKPAGQKLAFTAFVLGAYGFMVGADWISSRASVGALIHFQQTGINVDELIALYQLRYETLLTVIRVTTLTLSLIFIGLVLTGRSHYRKWHAVFNPIVLLIGSFVVYAFAPEIGKYIMPIALNVAFGIFFIISIIQARNIR